MVAVEAAAAAAAVEVFLLLFSLIDTICMADANMFFVFQVAVVDITEIVEEVAVRPMSVDVMLGSSSEVLLAEL